MELRWWEATPESLVSGGNSHELLKPRSHLLGNATFFLDVQENGDISRLCADARRCDQAFRGLPFGATSESSKTVVRKGAAINQVRVSVCLG